MMFQYLMSIRAFRGKLLVDHHSRAMELKVRVLGEAEIGKLTLRPGRTGRDADGSGAANEDAFGW
jgi:hypothetical protein